MIVYLVRAYYPDEYQGLAITVGVYLSEPKAEARSALLNAWASSGEEHADQGDYSQNMEYYVTEHDVIV